MKIVRRLCPDEHQRRQRRRKDRRHSSGSDLPLLIQLAERTDDYALRAAFATGDFRAIRSAVDKEVRSAGITKVAERAGIDRTTIYRAFRCENGPALDTMTKVLNVLGCRLIVEPKTDTCPRGSRLRRRTNAHSLTLAFGSADLGLAVGALAEALRTHENISELARKAALSRENLYRSFAFPRIPRFRTVVSFLDGLGLRLGVERLPSTHGGSISKQSSARRGARKLGRSTGDGLGRGVRRRVRNCAPQAPTE